MRGAADLPAPGRGSACVVVLDPVLGSAAGDGVDSPLEGVTERVGGGVEDRGLYELLDAESLLSAQGLRSGTPMSARPVRTPAPEDQLEVFGFQLKGLRHSGQKNERVKGSRVRGRVRCRTGHFFTARTAPAVLVSEPVPNTSPTGRLRCRLLQPMADNQKTLRSG